MSLEWVRLDANIASHDKVVSLVGKRNGYRAACVYMFSLGWSGGHGTDGFIPKAALPLLHGTVPIAEMLVSERLWEPADGGYRIRNYALRQEMAVSQERTTIAKRIGGAKGNCRKWHGEDCTCWEAVRDELKALA